MSKSNPTNLEQWLTSIYGLGNSVQITLLRSYTNDVYEIRTPDGRRVLKVYGLNWRTEDEIRYEVALIQHLATKGLRVAQPIAGKDGQSVYPVVTAKGKQFAVLFEYAEGRKPQPPFSKELYFAFGKAIGRMHEYSDDFVTKYQRKPLEFINIFRTPIAMVAPHIKNEEDRAFLIDISQKTAQKIRDLLHDFPLDWGPIHGDATLDNLHVTDDGQIVLYDFDSGGPGWRAADLQGWAYNNTEYAEKWEAFKQGYGSIRTLKDADVQAARYLSVAWLIWGLQIDLEQRVLAQGETRTAEYLATQLEAIKTQARLAFG
jgi:Ser/Thr protein kinase RdoA (MazF antagonist)